MSASARRCAAAALAIAAIEPASAGAGDDPRFQHHHLHRGRRAVLHRLRAGARLRRDARHRHHHHGVHRLHPDTADGGLLGALAAPATRARSKESVAMCACFASSPTTPSSTSCASGASAFRCRRCCRSWRSSLYFFHGLNFGIDFKGGTLIEVQPRRAPPILPRCAQRSRARISARCSSSNSARRTTC